MTQTLKMKRCKQGHYYCYKDKKCKRIPTGYRVGLGGWLRKENGEEQEDTKKNGNHSNGNGNGNSNGSSDGGGVSEGWSQKYKRSIDCNNPKGFSQRAHCQGRKKMSEEKKDHEYSMARSELKTVTNAAKRLQKKMGKKGEGNLQAWVQSKITKAADYIDTAADYVTTKRLSKKRDFVIGLVNPSQKMAKVVGLMLLQVEPVQVMNLVKEHQSAFLRQKEQV